MGGPVSENRERAPDLVCHLEFHHEPRIRGACRRGSSTRHQPASARVEGGPTLVATGERAGLIDNGPTYVSWDRWGQSKPSFDAQWNQMKASEWGRMKPS